MEKKRYKKNNSVLTFIICYCTMVLRHVCNAKSHISPFDRTNGVECSGCVCVRSARACGMLWLQDETSRAHGVVFHMH